MWVVIELQLFSNPKVVLLTADLNLVLYKYNKGYGWNIVEPDKRFQKDKVTTIKNDQTGRIVLVYYKEEDKI